MKKFQVGDKVILNKKVYPRWNQFLEEEKCQQYGIIQHIHLGGQVCRIQWLGDTSASKIYHTKHIEYYVGSYEDFLDKIRERLKRD